MSTILDALRKLQRERSAQSPAKDLRGSVTHEPAPGRARRRGAGSRGIAALLALLAVGGGGYLLYKSGQVQALLARFQPADDGLPSDEELAVMMREEQARDAAAARQQAPTQAEAVPPASQPAPIQRARPPQQPPRTATPPSTGVPHSPENPDMAAERARLEAALANARAAQEAQRQAELEAAAPPAVPQPAPEPEVVAETPSTSAPALPPAQPAVAKRKPPTAAKPASPVVAAKPKPARKAVEPAARPPAEETAESAPLATAFPDVRVESIRWHPIPERRVASLRFERQNAPEAREGDIVAGVLVYRINPGSVELRVGTAQRTVAPGP